MVGGATRRSCNDRVSTTIGAFVGATTGDTWIEWKPIWEHNLDNGLRAVRNGLETHLITLHTLLPLLVDPFTGRGGAVEPGVTAAAFTSSRDTSECCWAIGARDAFRTRACGP